MKNKSAQKKLVAPAEPPERTGAEGGEDHLGATEEQVGDRTGSGAGYDQSEKSKKKPARGGVIT
jgi:hypothetical protein